jgi:hypothetical protein
VNDVRLESPLIFLQNLQRRTPNEHLGTLVKSLRYFSLFLFYFFYLISLSSRLTARRLQCLLSTLQLTDVGSYGPLNIVADFATLLGTYSRGFMVITEPKMVDGDRNEVVLQFA